MTSSSKKGMLFAAFALAAALSGDAQASPSVPPRAVDIDLKAAGIQNVFRLLEGVSGKTIVLDPCVRGNVDLRLQNMPLPLVFDALAAKLGLVYEEHGDELHVKCTGGASQNVAPGATSIVIPHQEPKPPVRLSLNEHDALMDDVVKKLATAMSMTVDYKATSHPKVTLVLDNVRATTAMSVLSDTSGLPLTILNKTTLVVRDPTVKN